MKTRVFVDGQEGTTGLRIHEYLAQRADIEVLRIDADKRKDAGERARLLNAADVAFLCLPDAAAKEAAALVTNPDTCLIDASTAHRTAPGWKYGLPELAAGTARGLARHQAHRQSWLPCLGLHPVAAPAGGRRLGAGRPAAERHVDHRLLRRRQEDDRAVRGRR
jgi:N-acetyl-gamma-glutamyl-phosphate reductase uncommon form